MHAQVVHRAVIEPPDEDTARADLYALLALLWRQAPDAGLLQALGAQADDAALRDRTDSDPDQQAALVDAWRALCAAAATASAPRIADEYGAAFGGVGRPEVFLYASYYLSGFLHERPLAELRARLAALGLSRNAGLAETEDHVALLCETMRYLIRSNDASLAAVSVQRGFFHAHLGNWADALADAVEASPSTDFYRYVARLMRAFVDVERQAFDIE